MDGPVVIFFWLIVGGIALWAGVSTVVKAWRKPPEPGEVQLCSCISPWGANRHCPHCRGTGFIFE